MVWKTGVYNGQISTYCDSLELLSYLAVCVFGITLGNANIIPFTTFI